MPVIFNKETKRAHSTALGALHLEVDWTKWEDIRHIVKHGFHPANWSKLSPTEKERVKSFIKLYGTL